MSTVPQRATPRAGTLYTDRTPDETLVEGLRGGDPNALAAVHARYHGPLIGFSAKFVGGDVHEAEEIVQDVFIRATRAIADSDREIALRPWLYAIARNRAFDARRRQRPALGTAEDEAGAGIAALHADPASLVARRERLDSVVGHLNDLPTRQRRALVMRELEDRSHTQIGRALNVTAGASKALVHRARSGLGAN